MPAFAQMESETKIQSVVALPRPACFCLEQSLFCGQAFRWERKEGAFFGVAGDRVLTVAQTETQLLFYNASRRDVREFWVPYFSLDEDYPAVNALFARDPLLREAGKAAGGIRILRQDPWEALCSFIFSSNNNIPRITGMISRFFLRIQVTDRPGALANIAGILGNNGVSIEQVVQKKSHNGVAELVIITDNVRERYFNDALRILEGMSVIQEISGYIRVYG